MGRARQRKPCRDCGGVKEPGQRLHCKACHELRLPVWEREEYRTSVERMRTPPAPRRRPTQTPDGQAWCGACQAFKRVEQFGKATNRRSGLSARCRACTSARNHGTRTEAVYGITLEEYEALLTAQGGVCFICRTKPRKVRLAVDHDHRCCPKGKSCGRCVRGLLCKRCNRNLLGSAHDDTAILRRAIEYLDRPPAQLTLREFRGR